MDTVNIHKKVIHTEHFSLMKIFDSLRLVSEADIAQMVEQLIRNQ